MGANDRLVEFFFCNVLNDLVHGQRQSLTRRRHLLLQALRENRAAQRIALQHGHTFFSVQLRIVSALQPLQPLPVHSGKSKDMSQQRTIGIEALALHHHPDAAQRQLFQPPPLLRLDLPRQPDETLILPELLLQLAAANMEDRGKVAGHGRRILQRRGHAEHGGHLHIHREHLAVPIRHHAPGALERHSFLMLAIGLGREFCRLKHLERD